MNGKIIFIVLIILLSIQLIRPHRNNSPALSKYNIGLQYIVPVDVDILLKKACYDCHSNNTVYPWYNNVQPVGWWLKSHIDDGKKHLNFDMFTTYSISSQYKKLDEIIHEIRLGKCHSLLSVSNIKKRGLKF